jgi:N-acetylglucosaminyl-diphospho-decaprenol L-rhamnosyltransferase
VERTAEKVGALDLAIIIVTHNSAKALAHCLDVLDAELKRGVVVVDNASVDDTLTVARNRGVAIISNARNTGFARAANLGAKSVSWPYLCFLNPDCQAERELFAQGLETIGMGVRRCAVPMLNEGIGRVIPGCQPGYTPLKLAADTLYSNYGDSPVYRWLQTRPRYHDPSWSWPHGACLFIQRDFFLTLGGFDEGFFLYMEDVDLGHRITAAGGEIVQLPVCLTHLAGRSCQIAGSMRLGLLNLGRILYARKKHGLPLSLALGFLALPVWILRLLLGRSS